MGGGGKKRFNTQPHEGGCITFLKSCQKNACFNTQPHEGGCKNKVWTIPAERMFQHTAARRRLLPFRPFNACPANVSTHSRTKAAAFIKPTKEENKKWFQHTAARRRLQGLDVFFATTQMFQHTAARRRLRHNAGGIIPRGMVSTHSRTKAAADHYNPVFCHDRFQHTAARRRLLTTL